MSGNYGGSSLPTTPVPGVALVSGKDTVYKNFKCTTALDGTSFVYQGVTITMPTDGSMVEMVISPPLVSAQTGGVVFLCYDCSCSSPMTGSTAPSPINYSGNSTIFQPVIIGGGGLNS
mgnify:CR=1 FL=1